MTTRSSWRSALPALPTALACVLVLAGCGAAADRSMSAASGSGESSSTTTSVPAPTPATTSPEPVSTVTRTLTAVEPVPAPTRTVRDSSLARGTVRVRTAGRAGSARVTYRVVLVGGVETARTVVRRVVTTAPRAQVRAVGTKAPAPARPACDPNYAGACVPVASDVDCLGGSGNGPAYVAGPVRVVGVDIYDLDRDGDGIGCE